jgi:glycosyltransferase involved in cell wall biosynthesis
VESYRSDSSSSELASIFAVSGGTADLFRDVIVLKRATADERGVILLKYARTFDAMNAMFDVPQLMQRYTFVLEPCWAGYWHPSLLMFVVPGQPVFVQCFTEEDYRCVCEIGAPLVPLRMGPADWVDADLFKPPPMPQKCHDLVMVANWGRHKRHKQLFQALNEIEDRDIRVLLIGFPWSDRTAEDIRREAALIRSSRITVDVVEKLPPPEVARRVGQSRVFVFLSRKEGDNKALVEAMFVGVPAIVFAETIGGARSRINSQTGIFTSDRDLARAITFMLDHPEGFSPRTWALANTGSATTTRRLDDAIRQTLTQRGAKYVEAIVEKTNSPNLAYKEPRVRGRFQADYEYLRSCRLDTATQRTSAVA